VWLARRLTLPEDTPLAVSIAVFWYLFHLFCAGWVASSECGAFFAIVLDDPLKPGDYTITLRARLPYGETRSGAGKLKVLKPKKH